MPMLNSLHNPKIKAAVALRDRDTRLAEGMTLVDGAREARRAIEAGFVIESAFICPELLRSDEAEAVLRAVTNRAAPAWEVSERVHDRLAFGNRGDGIVLVVQTPTPTLVAIATSHDPLFLVTEDVEKPGNLGAILRTADGAGCTGVIAIGGTDIFNPNVVRASVGTVFSVPIAIASASEAIVWLKLHGVRIVTARVDGAGLYTEADLTGSVAIVLGSEANGLSDAWDGSGIESVAIPMLGIADSLNVAATAAVLAFEARRQRRTR